jgi:hypothetical protein
MNDMLRRIIEEAVRYCISTSQLGRRGMRTALPSRVADEVEEQLRRGGLKIDINGRPPGSWLVGEDEED